jgi:hypothetical protein
MTNLVTCSGCGKKISKNAPKCPKCGVKYLICDLCSESIAPNECIRTVPRYDVNGNRIEERDWAYIHLSCLEPHFSSPKHVKCPDCGQLINCPNFSLKDFDVDLASEREKFRGGIKTLVIDCSDCGSPDILGIYELRSSSSSYRHRSRYGETCPCCTLPIISAIHEFEGSNQGRFYHSFCHYVCNP